MPEFSLLLDLAYLSIGTLLIAAIWVNVRYKVVLLLLMVALSQLAALFAGRLIGNTAENAIAYSEEKKVLLKLAQKARPGDYLITDPALKRNHIIYGDILNIQYFAFDDLALDTLRTKDRNVFLYLNKKRVHMFESNLNETAIYTSADYRKQPDFVFAPDKLFNLIDSGSTYKLYMLR